MSNEAFIEFIWNFLRDAIQDPDYFYVSEEDMKTIKEELFRLGIPSGLN